jgi:hypothetical protein
MTDIRSLYTSLKHHSEAAESGLKLVPDNVIKQELITYVQADYGLIRKRLTRDFVGDSHNESLVEEVLAFRNIITSEES